MKKPNYKKIVEKYIDDISKGKKICGKYERLAVLRQIKDIERQHTADFPYRFDEKEALKRLNFFNLLKHFQGEFAGKTVILAPWQAFVIWCVFGWKKQNGNRRYNYADLELGRKNGKTTLAAGIALMMLLIDNEPGAQVYSAAVDREQAKICWEASTNIGQGSELISQLLRFYKVSIVFEDGASFYKPLSKDTKNKDGLNPSCAICDERHAWKTNEIYEVIKTGMGSRRQPLIFSITTAGLDMSLPYFSDLRHLKQILEGELTQENQFVMIFELDKEDDWNDKTVWVKANPNLGVSLSMEYLENEYIDAKNKGGSTEVNFKTKNLNQWVDAPEVWITDDIVKDCNSEYDEQELLGQECYAGFDFASHVDIVALSLFFVKQKVIKMFFWLPEAKIADVEDKVDYRLWRDQGYIRMTEGEVIDIEYILSDIVKIRNTYNIRNLSFDPYKMYHGLIQGLMKEGFDDILDEFSQSMANMSEPTKELQRMIVGREINLLGNPVMRWMFRNVVIYEDPNGNIKLNKGKSFNKIDGIVAAVNAIGGYMSVQSDSQKKTLYQTHTLRSIKL